jgi:glycosyltransferase involved in cell wall biosynthesis
VSAQSNMKLSVIICSHNPRLEYLSRTLEALRAQTMSPADWELLLIDNESDEPLASRIDLSWHPEGRRIREEELGLTPARLRGIAEAKSDLLVFVDDDNVLRSDYLEVASRISVTHPYLGAFGGSIKPEFEIEPDPRFESLLPSLAIRGVTGTKWANFGIGCVPYGAGLCARAKVAQTYAANTRGCAIRRRLGRRGDSLMGGEDLDLAMTSYDMGMGVGLFGELVVRHLIDKRRLSPQYLHRVFVEGIYSSYIVRHLHGGVALPCRGPVSLVVDSLKRMVKTCLGQPWSPAENAMREAERRAARDIRLLKTERKNGDSAPSGHRDFL